ncbi:MAG: hypothetical protein ABSD98_02395 [Candidatus Korobacteraceae bacterium]|jgi:hypothetical protein
MRAVFLLIAMLPIGVTAAAASKPHLVALGKAMRVKLFAGPAEDTTMNISVRPLYVDSKLKDFTTGDAHDVTDREFVVRRAYRINDALPDDAKKSPKWLWQRGGWVLVDRVSGKIALVKLPDFDPFYSEVSWYRDYAAYCGITSNGERVNAVVAEIGGKKALFRKELGKAGMGDSSDSNCAAPHWERQPPRVTFLPKAGDKFTVNVSGRFADEAPDNDSDEE